jgi:uncharacterized RDD family membrane protein YckC
MIGVELVVDHWRGRPIDSVGSNTLVFLVLGWLYFASLECNLGGTIGKLMVGLRVADVNGQPINFQRATGRYFGKILSALPLYIGFFMALFTERGQALHDKVASTVVIHRPITKEAAE